MNIGLGYPTLKILACAHKDVGLGLLGAQNSARLKTVTREDESFTTKPLSK